MLAVCVASYFYSIGYKDDEEKFTYNQISNENMKRANKVDIANLNLITPLDYRGGLDAYNKEVKKKQHNPIANKKIPNCTDRIERTLVTMANGDESVFNNLIDLLQLNTGLSKQKYHHCDDEILEALQKHYRKSPEQLMIIESAYKDA